MAEQEFLDQKLAEVEKILKTKQDAVLTDREKELARNKGLEKEKADLDTDLSIMDQELKKYDELGELIKNTGIEDKDYEEKHEAAKKRHAATKARRAQIEPEQEVSNAKIDIATSDPRILERLHEEANEEDAQRNKKEIEHARPEAEKEYQIRELRDRAKRMISKLDQLAQMPRPEGKMSIRRSYDGRPIVVEDPQEWQNVLDTLNPFDQEITRINARLRDEQSKRGLGKIFSRVEERHVELSKAEEKRQTKLDEISKIRSERDKKEMALNATLGEAMDYIYAPTEWGIPSFPGAKEEGESIEELIARRKAYLSEIITKADQAVEELNKKPAKKSKQKTA